MSNLLLTCDIFWDWIRSFLGWIDSILYSAISWFFQTMFIISNFQLNTFYDGIQQRVYVILGIFMLFKLLFSFLSYLVNPDKINDKEQGMGKLISRIIIVFVMLLALPTGFEILTELQNRLLPVVPRIVIGYNISSGDYFDDNTGNVDIDGISKNMSLSIYRAFMRTDQSCVTKDMDDASSNWDSVADAVASITQKCSGTKDYLYTYIPIIPALIAIAMLYVLISLNIDVAVRAFQLLILRSIAPVPIISYVDPKSSKDGMFSKWIKLLLTTWGRLFINLGLIYFVIYLISQVFTTEFWIQTFANTAGSSNTIITVLVLVFIIIGLLFFAREAPKFIMEALGIKNNGGFARMLGMGATALGGIGAARATYRARNKYDKDNNLGNHRLRNLGASLFSGLGAVETGGHAIMSTDKPTLSTGYDAIAKNNATALRRINAGSTLRGRLLSMGSEIILGQTPADKFRKRKEDLDNVEKQIKDFKSTLESRFDGNEDFMMNYNGHSFNWLNFDKTVSAANNGDNAAIATLSSWGLTTQQAREQYEKIHKEGYKQFTNAVVKKTGVNGSKDSVVLGKLAEVKDAIKGISVYDYDEFGELVKDASGNPVSISLDTLDFSNYSNVVKPTIGDISGTKRDLEASRDYNAAMADDKETKK